MAWQIYNILHIVGIAMILMSFGGIMVQQLGKNTVTIQHRRWLMITHGIGMVVILVAGFGLMAKKLGLIGATWPTWIWIKIGIWLLFGFGSAFVLRKAYWSKFNWFFILALVGFAAYIAIYKPS